MSAIQPGTTALTGDRFLEANKLILHPHMAEVWCVAKILEHAGTSYVAPDKPPSMFAQHNAKSLWEKYKVFDTKKLSEEMRRATTNKEQKTEMTKVYKQIVSQFHTEFCEIFEKKWYKPNDKWPPRPGGRLSASRTRRSSRVIDDWMPLELDFEQNEKQSLRPLIAVLVVNDQIQELAYKYEKGKITDFQVQLGYEMYEPKQEDFEKQMKKLKKSKEKLVKELPNGWKAVLKSRRNVEMMTALERCSTQTDFLTKFLLHFCEHRTGKKIFVGTALDSDPEIHLLREAMDSAELLLASTTRITPDQPSTCSIQ